jgi:predicted deacetylase
MTARYLVRFDDICPTMNWGIWERVETILDRLEIKPILAVIPNNADPKMTIDPPHPDFWDRVRDWQARGWTIGLHGDQHRYVTPEAGIIGINARSEFAGLSYAEQERKIANGLRTFAEQGVRADLFIAPAHSFDWNTVAALKTNGLTTISDGFFTRCVRRRGVTFIPQQLWRFRPMPFGVSTVCYHHNEFSPARLAEMERDLDAFRHSIVGVADVTGDTVPYGALDALGPPIWHALHRAARARRTVRESLRSRRLRAA